MRPKMMTKQKQMMKLKRQKMTLQLLQKKIIERNAPYLAKAIKNLKQAGNLL